MILCESGHCSVFWGLGCSEHSSEQGKLCCAAWREQSLRADYTETRSHRPQPVSVVSPTNTNAVSLDQWPARMCVTWPGPRPMGAQGPGHVTNQSYRSGPYPEARCRQMAGLTVTTSLRAEYCSSLFATNLTYIWLNILTHTKLG